MNKKKIAFLLIGLLCISFLSSIYAITSSDEENSSISIETFYTLKKLWTNFTSMHQGNLTSDEIAIALSEYQNQLLKSLNIFLQYFASDVVDDKETKRIYADFYPFVLSEIYFYTHIVANKPELGIIAHSELDKAIETLITKILPNDDTENTEFALLVAEELYTVNALFSYLNVVSGHENIVPVEGVSLDIPSDYKQQILLVNAFLRLEVMQKEKMGIENIVQLLNDPLAVFLIFYYPTYEYLQDDILFAITTYEEIFATQIENDITEIALAVYDCHRLLKEAELSAQTYGIPVESILLPQYENQYNYLRTAPLMTVAFTQKELVGFNNCLAYLSIAGELYVSRINSLAFRTINRGTDSE